MNRPLQTCVRSHHQRWRRRPTQWSQQTPDPPVWCGGLSSCAARVLRQLLPLYARLCPIARCAGMRPARAARATIECRAHAWNVYPECACAFECARIPPWGWLQQRGRKFWGARETRLTASPWWSNEGAINHWFRGKKSFHKASGFKPPQLQAVLMKLVSILFFFKRCPIIYLFLHL